jgi:hypothetical protein
MGTSIDHPLRGVLERFVELSENEAFSDPSIAANSEYSERRDKVFAIATALKALLEQTAAQLSSATGLSNMQNGIQMALDELNSFVANKNPAHIVNAAARIDDTALPYMWAFGPQTSHVNFLPEVLEQQAATARKSIEQLKLMGAALNDQFEALGARGTDLTGRLDGLIELHAKDRAEAAATVARLQQSFTESETVRTVAFEAALKEQRERFAAFEGAEIQRGKDLISFLEEKKNEAAKIVQVVGNIGVTGNYQQIATSEGKQANFWRWVTVAFFLGGLIVAGATFYKFWEQPFSPENAWAVAIRLLYAIAITAPAWYTAKESARHRTNSDRARQTELELASIGPFIELMPEPKKIEIREQLTKLYFGRPVEAHSVSSPVDLGSLKDLVVEVIKATRK